MKDKLITKYVLLYFYEFKLLYLFNLISLILLYPHLDMILRVTETKVSKRSLLMLNMISVNIIDI